MPQKSDAIRMFGILTAKKKISMQKKTPKNHLRFHFNFKGIETERKLKVRSDGAAAAAAFLPQ